MKADIQSTKRYTNFNRREGTTATVVTLSRPTNGSLQDISNGSAAMALATVNRCVYLIAKGVAKIELKYQRRMTDGTYVNQPEGDSLHYLLTIQPNDRMSANTFWQTVCIQCMLGGNAYAVPVRNENGKVVEIVLCTQGSVNYDEYLNIYTVNDVYNPHINGTYFAREILHFFYYSLDGMQGVSVLRHARQTMSISATGENETLDRFASGGMGRGIVGGGNSSKGDIFGGEHDYDELEETAVEVESQWRTGRRIASLPESVSYTGVNMSSADLEFLSTRKYEAKDICKFFQVDPVFIGEEGSSNYKEADKAEESFRELTLEPWLKMIENELQRKIVPSNLCHRYRLWFDRDMLYAASVTAKADYYTKMLAGIMTPNEVRAKEGLKPVENGDHLLMSANLKTIEGLMNEGAAPQPTPEPTPEPTPGNN